MVESESGLVVNGEVSDTGLECFPECSEEVVFVNKASSGGDAVDAPDVVGEGEGLTGVEDGEVGCERFRGDDPVLNIEGGGVTLAIVFRAVATDAEEVRGGNEFEAKEAIGGDVEDDRFREGVVYARAVRARGDDFEEVVRVVGGIGGIGVIRVMNEDRWNKLDFDRGVSEREIKREVNHRE